MPGLAPIALFAYKRLGHFRRTVEALTANTLARESHLYVFLDGAKGDGDSSSVAAVQEYAGNVQGFKSVTLTKRETNIGLSQSIVQGVTQVVETYGSVIVLEDDIVTSRHFLAFMNDALDMYRQELRVACIHGYSYPVEGLPKTFFLRGGDCWGWATWKRAWSKYNPDGTSLVQQLRSRNLEHAFDCDGSYPFLQMLQNQIAGVNDSWAIRWHASLFLEEMMTLQPGVSFVENIGHDGSGTHCGYNDDYKTTCARNYETLERIPVEENDEAKSKLAMFFQRLAGTASHLPATSKRAIFPGQIGAFIHRVLSRAHTRGSTR